MLKIRTFQFFMVFVVACFVACNQHRIASGTLTHLERFDSKYIASRSIDIWLPEGYNDQEKYAVIYMNDGKTLFDSSLSWNHQEWGVDEVLGKLLAESKIQKCIVVGIYNGNSSRHSEYMPQKPFECISDSAQEILYKATRKDHSLFFTVKVQSDYYLKFLVNELKPYIDSNFSTHKDSQHTFIAGSSMGGLISLYALCEYPHIFGGAACLSTHWTGTYSIEDNPIPAAIMSYLKGNIPSPEYHRIYFDYGTETLDTLYKPYQCQVDSIMLLKGYSETNWISKEFIGADHSEKSWNKRLEIPFSFLLGIKQPSN